MFLSKAPQSSCCIWYKEENGNRLEAVDSG